MELAGEEELFTFPQLEEDNWEVENWEVEMEEVEELFTSPQFLRRMGAGGAKPLLTKVISPLCSFSNFGKFLHMLTLTFNNPPTKMICLYLYL